MLLTLLRTRARAKLIHHHRAVIAVTLRIRPTTSFEILVH
jgi:hypothetical protein